MKDILLKTKPKKAILFLFALQFVLIIFVDSVSGTLISLVITNTLIFAYGLFLVNKEDFDSLKFFFRALIVLFVANLLLKLL